MSDLDPKSSDRIARLSPEKQALLAKRLKAKKAQSATSSMILRREDLENFPMSYAQQRMWFLNQWEPESPFYNISSAVRIYGRININAFQESFNAILYRHEVLRARFVTRAGQPVQVIDPEQAVDLPLVDLSHFNEQERESTLKDLIAREANTPFDLTKGPLIRCSLIRLQSDDHVLLLTMHHIVSDGWSIGLFIREAALLYEAYTSGKSSSLGELPIQYADFADWQRGVLQGEYLASQLIYWKDQLGSGDVVLELPFDRPRPPLQTYNGAHHRFVISKETNEQLKALGQRQEATPFMTLLAAYQALLYRYSGQDDIRVGTPIANRGRTEFEGLIGLFVNTLVMRADFSNDPTVIDLIHQVREMALGAYAHQDLPLEMLLDELNVARDMSRPPLYQVMFALQDQPLQSLQLSSTANTVVRFEVLEPVSKTAKFDLTLFMEDHPDGLHGIFEYNTDLFDSTTIEQMSRHFIKLLDSFAKDPNQKVSRIPLMTGEEIQQILLDWNKTFTDYPWDKNLSELFEAQVDRSPDAIALRFPNDQDPGSELTLTYRQLNERANQLAHYLQKLGVGPDVLVGIYMERSLEMVVATLGIIKAGGAYLPLDLGYPKDRLKFMLEDVQAPVLLTELQYVSNLPGTPGDRLVNAGKNSAIGHTGGREHRITICPDDPTQCREIESQPNANPVCQAHSNNLAYVMYTSGSTGRPKGVAIHQRAINRLVLNSNYIKIEPSDRIAHASNPSFDAATFEIWGALLNGAELVGVARDIVLSPKALVSYLQEKRVNTLFLTTALFNHSASEIPDGFATLKSLMVGGEVIDVNAARIVLNTKPPERLLNVYGPTESTTFATWYLFESHPSEARTMPIGKPLANTQIYILDRYLQPVPVGVQGELYIGGDGLASGYYNRDELTSEKFIINPFWDSIRSFSPDRPGDNRIYRTGDLARYLKDGNIEFLGRVDFQVKLRGLRIELGEIETAISQFPAIAENVVLLREDTPGDKRLVSYLIPKPGRSVNLSELRRFLKDAIPEFMVPSVFVTLDRLPINPRGKVDRRALPVPDQTRPDMGKAFVPPRSAVEKYLVNIFEQVLGINQVGIYDDFFELGGDSLKAAVLMNRLQEELDVNTHVRAVFMAPTVTDLAMYMSEYYPLAMEKVQREWGEEQSAVSSEQWDDAVGSKQLAVNGGRRETSAQGVGVSAIDPEKINIIRRIIKGLPPRPIDSPDFSEPLNPSAVFVLSPPRSGSTLLRTMLGGNPGLFSPPELDLLSFNTLMERRNAFSDTYRFWLEGVERAIMELKNCDADQAHQIMQAFEAQGLTTKQFYRILQQWIADTAGSRSQRLLVDKTPVYALDLEILRRAEQDFNKPYYIHLVRHPIASIYSFIEAKLDGVFFRYDHPFIQRELAELVWIISHQNILKFLEDIPLERQKRITFEEMVNQPGLVMEELCQFLGIEFDDQMLKPYESDRMTSGVRPGAQMVGDFKFYLRNTIDPKAADRWKRLSAGDTLSPIGWQIAEAIGYAHVEVGAVDKTAGAEKDTDGRERRAEIRSRREDRLAQIQRIPRDGELPLSFAQKRLWFLDQWEPGSPYYNIPAVVRLQGQMNFPAMNRTMQEIVRRHEVLRTYFPMVDGKPAQTIHSPDPDLSLEIIDLQQLPEEQREDAARALAVEKSHRSFNLAKGPLFDASLVRLGPEDSIFILIMHHIIADGWSVGVLIREIATLYSAYSHGKPSPLPDLPVQYIDYAAWQREWMRGDVLSYQLNYWRRKLENSPQLLELPTDRPRPAVQTLRGAHRQFEVPDELLARLRSVCQREEVTLFMALLAVFQILLYRYSSQEDICVGTPIANRTRAEVEGLIGFFVNTLVLRADFSNGITFHQLLMQVKQAAIDAYDHQDLPFEQLIDELHLSRDKSHTPLFQVMFTLQEAAIRSLKLPGLTLTPIQVDSGTAKFDILLTMVEMKNALKGVFEYNTDLFDDRTIERMIDHYLVLLRSVLDTPDRPVATLPILTETEKKQLLVDWNRTMDPETYTVLDHTIPQLFEQQVRITPDATAVILWDQDTSYDELNRRADRLAGRLRNLGVRRETIVGLCMNRSIQMIVGILAILKAGGAYLPLDPEYPQERLAFILKDAQAPVILTQESVEKKIEAALAADSEQSMVNSESWMVKNSINSTAEAMNDTAPITIVRLDDDLAAQNTMTVQNTARERNSRYAETIAGVPDSIKPQDLAEPRSLAYVIYTSGSTGRPKGVMIEHRSAINLWIGLKRVIYDRFGSKSLRVSLNAPLLFDASVQEWLMLLSGHTLVIIPQEVRQDRESLLKYIRDHKIDVLDCVPSQLKMLMDAGLLDKLETKSSAWTPAALLPGGEAIDYRTWQELVEAPVTEVYNMYGPTECTVDSTICHVQDYPIQPSVGRPIVNAQLYVLDDQMQPVPIGVPGELWIGGMGVGRGYLNREDLTTERFVPSPFWEYQRSNDLEIQESDRLYRTGDRVRYLPDGYLDYLGRVDFQVKLRGFRIELGEIEAVLLQTTGVKEAVVIIREDSPGEKQLVAYVVPDPASGELSVGTLRNALKTRLPEYMIPGIYVFIENIPMTPNRKVDRKALPKPEGIRPELDAEYQVPRTAEEQALAEIWAQVLKLDKVGIYDNFFELGGDSILSIQVVAKANQAGYHLTPRHIFEAQTIAELAVLVGTAPVSHIDQGLVTGPVPLTPIQRWFFEQDFAVPDHWNQALLFSVRIPLQIGLLREAVQALMRHHDALRTRFTEQDGLWIQQTLDLETEPPIDHINLSDLSPEQQAQVIEEKAAELQSCLNLTQGPLLRVAYFDLGYGKPARLLIIIHHLVIDGISWRILLEDLQTAYHQLSQGLPVDLPLKTNSFQSWAKGLEELAASGKFQDELDFWAAQPVQQKNSLPVDYPGGDNLEATTSHVRLALTAAETDALIRDVPAAYNTEINDVLLTALVQVIGHWTKLDEITIMMEGHGREPILDGVDISRTIGWFTSLYPLTLSIDRTTGPGERLMKIKEQIRQIPRHGIGFGILRYLSPAGEKLDQINLGEISFNYLGQVDQALPDDSPFSEAVENVGPVHHPLSKRTHMIDVVTSVTHGQLRAEWLFSEKLHKFDTVNALAQAFLDELRVLIEHCTSAQAGGYTPSDFPEANLTQDDIDDLLEELDD